MKKVYIDSNVMIQRGKPPGDALFNRVRDLHHAEKISLVTTDLTIREIAKHHAKNDFEKVKDFTKPKAREILQSVTGVQLPEIDETEMFEILFESYGELVLRMYVELDAEILSVNQIKPMDIFEQYAKAEGVFSSSSKKNQFPDAYIIEVLKAAEEEILVISGDKDFTILENDEKITHMSSLEELFGYFGLKSEPPPSSNFDPVMGEMTILFEDELDSHGFMVTDVADSEVLSVKVNELSIDPVVSFLPTIENDDVLLIGTADLSINLFYQHPDWDLATYDADDNLLVPHHIASGSIERDIGYVRFSLSYKPDSSGAVKEVSNLNLMSYGHQEVRINEGYYSEDMPF